jgi:hypothetical protein
MYFSQRAFLGQVPLAAERITQGEATWTAQNLCKVVKAIQEDPRNRDMYAKELKRWWDKIRGVKSLEEDAHYWIQIWCPAAYKMAEFAEATKPPPAGPPPKPPIDKRPPVATPSGEKFLFTRCFECGPGNYRMMLPMDASARGCKSASPEKCEEPKPPERPPVPSFDVYKKRRESPPVTMPTQQPPVTRPIGVPTPTPGSAPVGVCPAGQFWDGRQCRGSIAPGWMDYLKFGPTPSLISPAPALPSGGAAQYAMFGRLSGRIPISNL